MEEWRLVVEHPDFRVSNLGRLESKLSGQWKPRKLKRVNKGQNHGGRVYLGFNVPVHGEKLPSGTYKKRTLLIHVEILKAFVGPRPPGMHGLHLDDDRDNNALSNLKWGTASENTAIAVKNGKIKYLKGPNGKFVGSS